MTRRRGWCGVGAVMLLLLLVPTVSEALDTSRRLTQYSHRTWQEDLPQSTVHALLQTADGYLWIGTYAGLVRFDGITFTAFDERPPAGLGGRSVFALAEDPSGRLWIGTDHGLSVLENGRFTPVAAPAPAAGAEVRSIGVAGDGTVWATTAGGLLRITGQPPLVAEVVPLPGTTEDVAVDAAGGAWVTGDSGLWRLDGAGSAEEPEHLLRGRSCGPLSRGPDGTLWVATRHGIVAVGPEGPRPVDSPDARVLALLADRQGALWLGTEGAGLYRALPTGVERFDRDRGLSHSLVRCFLEDREGNLWIGTNGGLDQLRDGKVVTYGRLDGLSNEFVRTVFQDRSETVWIGTDGGGLDRFVNGRIEPVSATGDLPSSSVRALAQTRDGSVWIGTRGGLARLRGGVLTTYDDGDGLPSVLIRALYVDGSDRLWIGTEDAGVAWLEGDELMVPDAAGGLADADVGFFLESHTGRMWMGTGSGLAVLEGDRLRVLTTADGLSNDKVFTVLADHRGGLWVGTERGLNLLRNGDVEILTSAHGLIDDRIYSLLLDDDDSLWMSTSRGIGRVPVASLYDVLAGRASRVVMERFDADDGMASVHCNGAAQPAAWRAADGTLWFPTIRGVAVIDPRFLRDNPHPPPVVIERMVVDGQSIARDGARIEPGWSNLEIHYAGLSFSAPESVRFRYRLEGFDERWINAEGRRVAYYTSLPPGSYTFHVTAANSDGVWSSGDARARFTVAASFWQTPWARLLAAVLVVGTVAAVVRLRLGAVNRRTRLLEEMVSARTAELDQKHASLADKVQQLEISEREAHEARRRASEANRAKSIFLSNMSHELRTPLNSIIGFAGILRKRLEDQVDDKLYRFINNIYSSGEHLLNLINDLLDLSKIEAGRMEISVEPLQLRQVVESVLRLMQGAVSQRDITIEVDLADDLPTVFADPVRMKQILFNLVSNAVKFSGDGSTVIIRARPLPSEHSPLDVDSVQVDVVDHGIGIAEQHQHLVFDEFRQVDGTSSRRYEGTGLGLALVRRIVSLMGGRIDLRSTLGEGSTFTVILPTRVQPRNLDGDEPPALLSVTPTEAPSPPAGSRGSTVLVVEDDPLAFHQLASSLESDGYRVIGARTGEEALHLLEAEQPDLVTLDLVLPGLDGWSVLRQLRTATRTRDIPVLIVTRKENRDASLALGTEGFFVKPVDQEVFLHRVRELVDRDDPEGARPTILVVDDEPEIHQLLRAVLEPAGYGVVTSLDGPTALDMIARDRPDLVILDLIMPGMSGFEVAHRLRSDPATADIPIIVLTVKQLTDAERERLAGQITALITKDPACTLRLSETVRGLLE